EKQVGAAAIIGNEWRSTRGDEEVVQNVDRAAAPQVNAYGRSRSVTRWFHENGVIVDVTVRDVLPNEDSPVVGFWSSVIVLADVVTNDVIARRLPGFGTEEKAWAIVVVRVVELHDGIGRNVQDDPLPVGSPLMVGIGFIELEKGAITSDGLD